MREIELAEKLLLAFIELILCIANMFLMAYVISLVCRWYLMDILFIWGIQDIYLSEAMGLVIIIQILNLKRYPMRYNPKVSLGAAAKKTFGYLFFLLFAYIVKHYI